MKDKTNSVLIGLSGGVDSAVAAKLLVEEGFDVTACTLRLLPSCTDREKKDEIAIEKAKKIAQILNIPHVVYDGRKEFKEKVIDYFLTSYKIGETPNPCYICNRCIKFGFLLEQALKHGFRYIATGHYARLKKCEEGKFSYTMLLKGKDEKKDQSYFLSSLNQHQLAHSIFPLGNFQKEEVKQIARDAHLISQEEGESQDICFVENGDVPDFVARLSEKNSFSKGFFIGDSGKILKEHKGMQYYTIGQRRGLDIAMGHPIYVVSKNIKDNTITVGEKEKLKCSSLIGEDLNLIRALPLNEKIEIKARTRYRQMEKDAYLTIKDEKKAYVQFAPHDMAVAKGQIVAFYRGDECLGSAIIKEVYP